MPKMTTEWQRFEQLSANALYAMLQFRQNIFVVEQCSPYPDLDGLDHEAWHLLLWVEGELGGYLRVVPMLSPPPRLIIGRVAVVRQLRRHGLGRMLMEEALQLHRRHYPARCIALSAQVQLVPFYKRFGFGTNSEPYDEFGVTHVDMQMRGIADVTEGVEQPGPG
jgi:ElaA protein